MALVRRALRSLAAVCVCCQVVGYAASPVVLCFDGAHDSAAPDCTCAHGDHTTCPMHHSAPTTPRSKSDCSCKSTADPASAILVAIVGPTAVMPDRVALDAPRSASALDRESRHHLQPAVAGPDGPPPRA